jgi:hypothetical protein
MDVRRAGIRAGTKRSLLWLAAHIRVRFSGL